MSIERIFKTKTFARWMEKTGLGGNVVKKRVALPGRGESGGVRSIVATNLDNLWFFLFGFEKKDRGNIDTNELKALQELALHYLAFGDQEIKEAISHGKLMEVCNDNKKA